MNTHYVYFWSHKDFGILYIGQGTHGKNKFHSQKYSRAYAKHKKSSIDGFLKNRNIKPDITILCDNLTKENTLRRLEKHIPLEQSVIKKIQVKINGIIYNSILQATRETGLTEKHIRYWYNKGKYCL